MDFMRLLKSIEELLYELVTWFVFYPATLWRILRHPQLMLAYAEKELTDRQVEQYDDTLSPPILLLLTLVLLHLSEGIVAGTGGTALPGFLADDRNLLVFRAVALSLLPLFFAVASLRVRGARLTRAVLKPAFYSQSYAAVPFILLSSLGTQLTLRHAGPPALTITGAALIVLALIWYLANQTLWLARSIEIGRIRAALIASGTFILAIILLFSVTALVAMSAAQTNWGVPTG